MRAYYFDNIPGDQRLPHDSGTPVSDHILKSLGLLHWYIPTSEQNQVDTIAEERDHKNKDTMNVTKQGLGDLFEEKLKSYYQEHMHEEEEIRYILEGTGFWDVREHLSDSWIRCQVDTGDLIVLPAGIYHRFTLGETNMIKALRLFKDEPKWTPINRGDFADVNPSRVDYLNSLAVN